MGKVTVIPTEGAEETLEIMAQAITDISEGFRKILTGPLKRDTLVLLIQNAIPGGMSKRDVNAVLDVIPELRDIYLSYKK